MDIRAKFGIPNSPKSPDTGQNSDEFRISGQSFINKNCRNSRTSHDIDMKLGPVTKVDKRIMATSKMSDDDVTSINCDVIVFFPLKANLQPSASRVPDAWSIKFTF